MGIIDLLVLILVVYLILTLVNALPFPGGSKQIVGIILAVVLIVWLLRFIGVVRL